MQGALQGLEGAWPKRVGASVRRNVSEYCAWCAPKLRSHLLTFGVHGLGGRCFPPVITIVALKDMSLDAT